jgi:hypothetical protein
MNPAKDHSSSSAYYRDQANQARQRAAEAVPGSDMKKSWTEIAASYDKLAVIAEGYEGHSGAKS